MWHLNMEHNSIWIQILQLLEGIFCDGFFGAIIQIVKYPWEKNARNPSVQSMHTETYHLADAYSPYASNRPLLY